jgi:hypothetical protein
LPPTTVIRLLLFLLPYLSISPISHFGIILTLWLIFNPIMHSSLLLLSYRIIALNPSSNTFNDPIRTAHYYTLIGKDSSRWQYLIPKFSLYTMSDKD